MGFPARIITLSAAVCAALSGCIDPASPASPHGVSRPDSLRNATLEATLDSLLRANDSLRTARARDSVVAENGLARLAASIPRLPIPMGTRYYSAPAPAAKASAAQACRGDRDIFALERTTHGVLGLDTVTYYGPDGQAHCERPPLASRETHARYLLDPNSGEAREAIAIDITEDDALPRYRTHGTGKVLLNGGMVLTIDSFDVDMLLDNSTRTPIYMDARLRISTADGYVFDLVLARPHPFRALDFFPAWEDAAADAPVMSGPILFQGSKVGALDLFADRSVAMRDASGKPLPVR